MSWREKFQDRLDNLAMLSPDQLAELDADLTAEFDAIDEQNGSLADLSEISTAISQVREQAATSESSLAEMRANVHPVEDTSPDGDDDDNDSGEDDSGDDDDVDQEDVPGGEPVDGKLPVAASATTVTPRPVQRPPLRQLARAQMLPANRQQKRIAKRATTQLVAAGDVPGFGVGQEITSHSQLSNAFVKKLQALGRGGTPDDVLVASMIKQYPEERQLGADPYVNTAKMDAVLKPEALVAYGGICEPVAVDYSIDTIGSTARPARDALPSFGASRGGVSYFQPPVLSTITPPTIWTIADDQGGTKTKPCMRITCQNQVSAYVYAIPVCIEVGNFMGRFSPEHVAAQVALLDVAAARVADLAILNAIDAGSTAVTTAATATLGASRTVLQLLDQAISAYEYRYRLLDTSLRLILPDWVHDLLRADMVASGYDSANNNFNNLAVTDAQIAAWFAARNVNPSWTLEDVAGSWGSSQAAGALNAWPTSFDMYLFAEGTWQFLDGGQIDLGVVRDSTLNSTNDYQIWREDFEGVAKRGNESLKVTVNVDPSGLANCCAA